MLTVSASSFRQNLFEYLDHVASGETIIILRNNVEVARVTNSQVQPWRVGMPAVKLLVEPETIIEPLDDVWDAYT